MTDATGHKNRLGAGPFSNDMLIGGIPLNVYINLNPQTARVEIVKPMPRGVPDEPIRDFLSHDEAWAWAKSEFDAGRLPLRPSLG
jgi:hypothetical protein